MPVLARLTFLAAIAAGVHLAAADAPVLKDREQKTIPPIAELVTKAGDAEKGKVFFTQMCIICHQINGQGVDFGPNLSEVGTKRAKDYIFQSILDPSAVIEPAFEMVMIKLDSDESAMGLVASETDAELALKAIGGVVTKYKKAEIVSRTKMKVSAMPAGLQGAMTTDDLVNLVEFLAAQKKK
jgi:putative heme-binding domain-containing protein